MPITVDYKSNIALHSIELGREMTRNGLRITVAESCTGGGIAQAITSVAGSSAWFEMSWVTYSNDAKHTQLNVDRSLIDQQGAVSKAVCIAMALGALKNSQADFAIAATGIAGPGGGTNEKPVGMVWLSWVLSGSAPVSECCHFKGDRYQVREQAICHSLSMAKKIIKKHSTV